MSEYVTVAVDAMGGDNGAKEMVMGAVLATKENDTVHIVLCGDEQTITKELSDYEYDKERIRVVATTQEVSCDASPVMEIQKKKDSSMVVAMKLVKSGEADAFISAGSSGAVLVGGQVLVGRMKGVDRAPLAPIIPNKEPPLVMRTNNANTATMTSTGMTPAIPFFTTFLPALLLENRPKVSDPNSAGIR